jgi:hypothetical protein
MHIVSNAVQEGAVWPVQPPYDILLQEGAAGLYLIWMYIYCERCAAGGVSVKVMAVQARGRYTGFGKG